MSALLTTPAEILEHLRSTDAAASTLDRVLSSCGALTADERAAWTNLHTDYVAFSVQKKARWTSAILNTIFLATIAPIVVLEARSDDARIAGFEDAFRGWEAVAAKKCGLAAPVVVGRDSPNSPQAAGLRTLEHIATAGAVMVGGVALLVGLSYARRLLP